MTAFMDEKKVVGVVYLDFLLASDSVKHGLLGC